MYMCVCLCFFVLLFLLMRGWEECAFVFGFFLQHFLLPHRLFPSGAALESIERLCVRTGDGAS